MLDEPLSERTAAVWSSNRRQACNAITHAELRNHVARVQSTHAVRDDVRFLAAGMGQDLRNLILQFGRSLRQWACKVNESCMNIEVIVMKMARDAFEVTDAVETQSRVQTQSSQVPLEV